MKGFRFRLEPVLTLRRHKEESLQVKLAESRRALETEAACLEALQGEMSLQKDRLASDLARGPLDTDRLHRESVYLGLLERRIQDQAGRVKKLADQVAEDREAVLQASREKKALQRLRETMLLSFAREEARKEQKVAEEMATTRHSRQLLAQENV